MCASCFTTSQDSRSLPPMLTASCPRLYSSTLFFGISARASTTIWALTILCVAHQPRATDLYQHFVSQLSHCWGGHIIEILFVEIFNLLHHHHFQVKSFFYVTPPPPLIEFTKTFSKCTIRPFSFALLHTFFFIFTFSSYILIHDPCIFISV